MSRYDYQVSREISAADLPFGALLMAAGLQAADEIAAGNRRPAEDGLAARQQVRDWQQSWDPRSGMGDQALRDNGIRG